MVPRHVEQTGRGTNINSSTKNDLAAPILEEDEETGSPIRKKKSVIPTCFIPIFWLNIVISVCNAVGAFVASAGGQELQLYLPGWFASWLAAAAFFYLACLEGWSWWQDEESYGGGVVF